MFSLRFINLDSANIFVILKKVRLADLVSLQVFHSEGTKKCISDLL